jgi:hypothetical protein
MLKRFPLRRLVNLTMLCIKTQHRFFGCCVPIQSKPLRAHLFMVGDGNRKSLRVIGMEIGTSRDLAHLVLQ